MADIRNDYLQESDIECPNCGGYQNNFISLRSGKQGTHTNRKCGLCHHTWQHFRPPALPARGAAQTP